MTRNGRILTGIIQMIAGIIFAVVFASTSYGVGGTRYIEFKSIEGAMELASKDKAAPILIDSQDYPGVIRAAHDLQTDIGRVTGNQPNLLTDSGAQPGDVVIVGTLGKNRRIDELVRSGKLDVAAIRGHWESFIIQVIPQPWPGVKRAVVIVGSDKRATIFGIYDLSQQIGVSPWYWWADVPTQHHDQIFIRAGRYQQGEPAVKYRGIFINDEAPSLTGWVHEKFGNYNHEFYAKVFELILRMKGNFLCRPCGIMLSMTMMR